MRKSKRKEVSKMEKNKQEKNKMSWTPDQAKAIYTRDCNLLVAAAAGSGKTAVLVERIIKMITDEENPIDIDKLLVVTFTNAAASEMRERIGDAISKAIRKSENSKNLQRQLALLNKASITTIHSFCLEVIKNNFHMIDLDPGFRVGDATEAVLLKNEAMDELFDMKYEGVEEGKEEDFKLLIETFCGNKNDEALRELLLKIYDNAMSMPSPMDWLYEKVSYFDIDENFDFKNSIWAESIMEDSMIEIKGMVKQMEKALNIISSVPELEPYYETFNNELEMLMNITKASEIGWEHFIEAIGNVSFARMKRVKSVPEKEVVNAIRNKIKEKLNGKSGERGIKDKILSAGSAEYLKDIRNMCGTIRALAGLLKEFHNSYMLKKKDKGIIDFNDFEHFALELLIAKDEKCNYMRDENGKYIPSQVAEQLRNKYDEIMIDEYQDSNMVQEVLLNMISKVRLGEPNVFMVGDVKQSIYRFRQANPSIFLEKYNNYSLEEGEKFRKILLFKNFRSDKNVIEGVNFIFEQIMSRSIGELDYDENEALNFGASYYEEARDVAAERYRDTEDESIYKPIDKSIELHIIENENKDIIDKENSGEDDSQAEEDLNKIELEAKFIAHRIRELIDGSTHDKNLVYNKGQKIYRPINYKDIVILLRSTANWAPVFVEELKKADIPVYADIGSGYFDTTEVKTILSLLKIIDNPVQDIPLLAVMRSPIGGFNEEDFVEIRRCNRDISFYDASIRYSEGIVSDCKMTIDKRIREKLCTFFLKLNNWREKSIHVPIDEFIWSLYTETGYYGFAGALNGGIQRQANLKILFQRARAYEKTSYKGLFNFINFIEKLRKSSGDMGSAKIIGENENVVRLMSIHKSKGLEFPVVFVSGLGKQFNLQDLNSTMLLHQDLGFGMNYVDVEKRISYPTMFKEVIRAKIKRETLSEEMRILYVALTRAREKLILTGAVKNTDKFCEKASQGILSKEKNISESYILGGKTYLDWITPCVMRHRHGEILIEDNEVIDKNEAYFDHDSSWKIKIWNRKEIEDIEFEEQKEIENIKEKIEELLEGDGDKSIERFIHERLSYKYEFQEAVHLPTVMTVTEIKRRASEENLNMDLSRDAYVPKIKKRPSFMEEAKGLTGAERGTAVHNSMQVIDFNEVDTVENIKNQLYTMVDKELLTQDQMEAVDPDKIKKFFDSSLGQRLLKAVPNVYREVKFAYELKCTDVFKYLENLEYGGRYNDETIKLQGIIDLYFDEGDDIILVDYKTDRVTEDTVDEIVERYRVQLDYYGRAIEQITKKKVKGKYLYLFGIDREVEVK